MNITPEILKKFFVRIDTNGPISSHRPDLGPCWIWKGATQLTGYGSLSDGDKILSAHRLSHELFKHEIPKGMETDHLCRVRHCVNPDHLEAVTPKENNHRGAGVAGKDYCRRGHLYDEENTLYKTSSKTGVKGRLCRICRNYTARMAKSVRSEKKRSLFVAAEQSAIEKFGPQAGKTTQCWKIMCMACGKHAIFEGSRLIARNKSRFNGWKRFRKMLVCPDCVKVLNKPSAAGSEQMPVKPDQRKAIP